MSDEFPASHGPDIESAADELERLTKDLAESNPQVVSTESTGGQSTRESPERAQRKRANDTLRGERQRAQNQREAGLRHMQNVRPGVMTVEHSVCINDARVASNITRFMPRIDSALTFFKTRGQAFLPAEDAAALLTHIADLCMAYADAGAESLTTASALHNQTKDALGDDSWMEPTYKAAAIDIKYSVSNPEVFRMVGAAHKWDEAIRLMCELEWNGGDPRQTLDLRSTERDKLYSVFAFMRQTANSMNQLQLKATQARLGGSQ